MDYAKYMIAKAVRLDMFGNTAERNHTIAQLLSYSDLPVAKTKEMITAAGFGFLITDKD